MDQPRLLGCRNRGRQHAVDEGHGFTASPRLTLEQPVPSEPKVPAVRRSAGSMGDAGGQVDAVASHEHGVFNDVLLDFTRSVAKLPDIDAHFTFEHPCFGEGFPLGSVVIPNQQVNLTRSEPAHREAPLNRCRECHGQDIVQDIDLTSGRQEQQPLVERGTNAVDGGVLDAQPVVVADLQTKLGDVTQTVGVRDADAPPDGLRWLKPHHGV